MDKYLMRLKQRALFSSLLALFGVVALSPSAIAEDIEVYLQQPVDKVNLMFLLDTSNTMNKCSNTQKITCGITNNPTRLRVMKEALKGVVDELATQYPDVHIGFGGLTGSESAAVLPNSRMLSENEVASKDQVGDGKYIVERIGGGFNDVVLNGGGVGGYVLYPLRKVAAKLSDESETPKPIENRKVGAKEDGDGKGSGDSFAHQNENGDIVRATSDNRVLIPSADPNGAAGFIFKNLDIPNGAIITEAKINYELTSGKKREPELFPSWTKLDLVAKYYSAEDIPNFKYSQSETEVDEDAVNVLLNNPNLLVNDSVDLSLKLRRWGTDLTLYSDQELDVRDLFKKLVNTDGWCGGDDVLISLQHKTKNNKRYLRTKRGARPALYVSWKIDKNYERACGVLTKRIASSGDNAYENSSGVFANPTNKNVVLSTAANKNVIAYRFRGLGLTDADVISRATLRVPIKNVYDNKNNNALKEDVSYTFQARVSKTPLDFEKHTDEKKSLWESGERLKDAQGNELLITATPQGTPITGRPVRKSFEKTEENNAGIGWLELDVTPFAKHALACGETDDDGAEMLACDSSDFTIMLGAINGVMNKDLEVNVLLSDAMKAEEDDFSAASAAELLLRVNTDMSNFEPVESEKMKHVLDRLTTTGRSKKRLDLAYLELGRYMMDGKAYFGMGKHSNLWRVIAGSNGQGVTSKSKGLGPIQLRSWSHRGAMKNDFAAPTYKSWPLGLLTYTKHYDLNNRYNSSTVTNNRVEAAKEGGLESCDKNAIIIVTDGEMDTPLFKTKTSELFTHDPFYIGKPRPSTGTGEIDEDDDDDDNFVEDNNNTAALEACGAGLGQRLLQRISGPFGQAKDKAPYQCMAALATHLNDKKANNKQNAVQTHVVAFQLVDKDRRGLLPWVGRLLDSIFDESGKNLAAMEVVSNAGGGKTVYATDQETLKEGILNIINSIMFDNASMAAPGIAVDKSTSLEHLNELYYGLFKPQNMPVWGGNLKRYGLDNLENNGSYEVEIVGEDGEVATNAETGLFLDDAVSFWSSKDEQNKFIPDGNEMLQGGALEKLLTGETSANRKLFYSTDSVENGQKPSANDDAKYARTAQAAAALKLLTKDSTDGDNSELYTLLGLKDERDRAPAVEWLLHTWGDHLHSEPKMITYPGNKRVIYASDNNGLLHAIDSSDGTELFAFSPAHELKKTEDRILAEYNAPPLHDFYNNPVDPDKGPQPLGELRDKGNGQNYYGLDSTWTFWQQGSPTQNSTTTVYGYAGQRRGGKNYYALDLTNPEEPKLLWSISKGGEFHKLGQTWSEPQLAKIRGTNGDIPVLVFAGGYDRKHDKIGYAATADEEGSDIYIVNAYTGALIWSASKNRKDGDAHINYSIPATPAVVDVTGDGYFDYIYVADITGQLFRVDMDSSGASQNPVAGVRKVADLSGGNRKFYATPSIALGHTPSGDSSLQVVLGSGYRAHPLSENESDYVYGLFDTAALKKSVGEVIKPNDLYSTLGAEDPIAGNHKGWQLELENGVGEKYLSESAIVSGTVLFTTYTTQQADTGDRCNVVIGKSRLYAVDLLSGGVPEDNPLNLPDGEIYKDLSVLGIPPKPQILVNKYEGGGNDAEGACNRSLVAVVGTDAFDITKNDLCGLKRSGWFESSEEKAKKLVPDN